MLIFKRLSIVLTIIISFAFSTSLITPPDEGMYPLSEIRSLDLQSKGLQIPIDEVYNQDGISLVDALVKVGGCTGSFVSEEGLILTNHHCSFGAVQRASTTENNYLENGFLAETREEEIPAKGLSCRITVSYEDVSEEVLEAADKVKDISERTEAISDKIKEIIKREEEKDSTIDARVSEMFVGESYVLFRYKVINDVRLVYVPPRSIGEFGGESDNWIWPRHTGDFSFLRAYVAPDGSPAEFSEENVPYSPKKFLQVNPDGVNEGDFVFLLGYPGRTFKHLPSYYVEYQYNYQLPYINDLFAWIIDLHEEISVDDPEYALEISSIIKSLANVEKNYRGKIQGIERLDLIEKKRSEERKLQQYINSNPELKTKYGNLLKEIEEVYSEMLNQGRTRLVMLMLSRNSDLFSLAELVIDYHLQKSLAENEKDEIFQEENTDKLYKRFDNLFNSMDEDIDGLILSKMLFDATGFSELNRYEVFNELNNIEDQEEYIKELYDDTDILDPEEYYELLNGDSEDVLDSDDLVLELVREIIKIRDEDEAKRDVIDGRLNILLAQLMDAKRNWMNKKFVPDANSTLRLTYGYIKGYSPADAVYYSPITSLRGVIEKGEDEGDYKMPSILEELHKNEDYGKFVHPEIGSVPVAILYNTDTSGGNSGSPIMDAYGNVVGVNFDRSFEATINDFTWSEDYSRSIGVDIRYILWVTQKVGGADYLLDEMNVEY